MVLSASIGLTREQNQTMAKEVWATVDGGMAGCRRVAVCPDCLGRWESGGGRIKEMAPPFFPAELPLEYASAFCNECDASLIVVELGLSREAHHAYAEQVWLQARATGTVKDVGVISRCGACHHRWLRGGQINRVPPAFPADFSGHCRECGGELHRVVPL